MFYLGGRAAKNSGFISIEVDVVGAAMAAAVAEAVAPAPAVCPGAGAVVSGALVAAAVVVPFYELIF